MTVPSSALPRDVPGQGEGNAALWLFHITPVRSLPCGAVAGQFGQEEVGEPALWLDGVVHHTAALVFPRPFANIEVNLRCPSEM